MRDLIQPCFKTKPYRLNDVVFIKDRYQSFLYCKSNVFPVDMYVSTNDDLVMVFDKEETKELYKLYREYKLK